MATDGADHPGFWRLTRLNRCTASASVILSLNDCPGAQPTVSVDASKKRSRVVRLPGGCWDRAPLKNLLRKRLMLVVSPLGIERRTY
jgi:hypothetical protein